ncbi:MucR family transcriptional regulator [Lysinibacillus sp. Ag94]|uniref:MucR family transcriptional regulator n=1 Tax=Lysinibacillus sp. Ag94 TaxID=2936682 RepID=UPI00200F9865|nr:MucR family transcriptional regulator [Lysinibacillus sp. Ag94]UPW82744.1 MucR family transcriptional regulator [Lysinibacillus sp. Ag94]
MSENYWSSKNGGYIKCPVEGCNHIGIIVTAAHCRLEHGMTREEVREKYGLPQTVLKLNRKQNKSLKGKENARGDH